MPDFSKHDPGTFCYAELATNDPDKAGKFYTGLFGWNRNDQDMGEFGIYTQFQVDGKVVAAQYRIPTDQEAMNVPPNWGQYVSVDDADAVSARAAELGGTVVMGPMDVMGYGRMSVLADPAGAVFCIWQAGNNCGLQLRNEPNTMCWNELMTPDTEGAKAFYGGLFGWEMETKDLGDLGEYILLNHAPGKQAGGMMAIQPAMGPIPAHWLVYFLAPELEATHEKALSLGAKVMVGPMDIPEVGRFSVLSDPTGAVFAIYEPVKPA